MLKTLFVIGIGSFAGGALRYLASRVIQNTFTCSIPLGTLFVNIMGCFIIGLLYGLFEKGQIMNTSLRLFLTVGFCGGFTTFSTFMNESFQLVKGQDFFYLAFYLFLSLIGGFAMLYLGHLIVK